MPADPCFDSSLLFRHQQKADEKAKNALHLFLMAGDPHGILQSSAALAGHPLYYRASDSFLIITSLQVL